MQSLYEKRRLRGLKSRSRTSQRPVTDYSFRRPSATIYPYRTFDNAEHSKRLYTDLSVDKDLLLQLKDQWTKKLHCLRAEGELLQKMKRVRQEDVHNIPPLFEREVEPTVEMPDIKNLFSEDAIEELFKQSMSSENISLASDGTGTPTGTPTELLPPTFLDTDIHSMNNTLYYPTDMTDGLFSQVNHNIYMDPSLGENYKNDEEEETRKALSLILDQLGDIFK
ncbi:hypothetical protein BDB01DRAFT_848014 [Pilobolus umbonatus]|nr:hypothetical protein BDB01DRAFT_848014 [Pilobolus umbonatus]